MKKLSLVSAIILSIIAIAALSACSEASDAKKELSAQTIELNSHCPQSIGMAGELVSAKYDKEANRLTMSYMFNPQIASLDVISANKELYTDMIKLTYSGENMSDFIGLVEKSGCSFVLEISLSGSSETVELMLSPEDIKEIQSMEVDETVMAKKFLDFTVFTTAARTPFQVDEATVLVNVSMSDSAFVYDYTIDENLMTLDQLRELSQDLKKNVAMAFRDHSMQAVLKNLSILDKGLVYRYTDSRGEDFVEIVYTPDELNWSKKL